ncbi:hypothetical protein GF373_05060 [bacterium]|nr:hypothetical protein [bacterium]
MKAIPQTREHFILIVVMISFLSISGTSAKEIPSHRFDKGPYAFSPNGSRLMTWNNGKGPGKLWDVKTGELIKTLEGGNYKHGISNIVFSPNGKHFITTVTTRDITNPSGPLNIDEDVARLWNIESGKIIRTLNQKGPVATAAFSPDGTTLLTGSGETYTNFDGVYDYYQNNARYNAGEISLWDVITGNLIQVWPRINGASIFSVGFSPDGEYLFFLSSILGTGNVWQINPRKGILGFPLYQYAVVPEFSPNSNYLLYANDNHSLSLWNVKQPGIIRNFGDHQDTIRTLRFSPNGEMFLSSSEDGTVRLWSIYNEQAIGILKGTAGEFSPDGNYILTGDWVLDANSGERITDLPTTCSCFSPDGTHLLSETQDAIILWDISAFISATRASHFMPYK